MQIAYKDLINLSGDELRSLLAAEELFTEGLVKILRKRCQTHNLPIAKEVTSGLEKRWMDAQKGLKQICIERGLVSLEKTLVDKYYSKDGKKVGGEVGQCKDTREEQSRLKKIADSYGYEVWFTPKYHCEFAGEGIEYMRGYKKLIYCRIPKKDMNKKDNFIASLKMIVNRNLFQHWRISRRAQRYISEPIMSNI